MLHDLLHRDAAVNQPHHAFHDRSHVTMKRLEPLGTGNLVQVLHREIWRSDVLGIRPDTRKEHRNRGNTWEGRSLLLRRMLAVSLNRQVLPVRPSGCCPGGTQGT